METYLGVKIPKNNGRPQLWLRGVKSENGNHTTIRIIYPNGKVEYTSQSHPGLTTFFYELTPGCTSRKDYLAAVKATIKFDLSYNRDSEPPIFLGYI